MASKYLTSLPEDKRAALSEKLWRIQNHKCYICEEEIDEDTQLNKKDTTNKKSITEIDHIVPLANKGKDSEENFAITHASCNRSKQDANLKVARILQRLRKIQEKAQFETRKSASLEDILAFYEGSKYKFQYHVDNENDILKYSFSETNDNTRYTVPLFTDRLSGEKFCFIEVPIKYIFHDKLINPRGINNSISKLIKEFDKKNPQLHLSLARIDEEKIKIFDGQHKAVAQILLGAKKFVIRVFTDPDVKRLIETNTNAGSTLRQIAFDKSILRQLNNALYEKRVKEYQENHKLTEDDYSFSEKQLIEFFRNDRANIKKCITDSIKHAITYDKNNKLRGYIDFEGKSKELPISYSAFDKTILSSFVNPQFLDDTIDSNEGRNLREIEIEQIVKTLNILAENIYIDKFILEVGTARIESKVIEQKDSDITDEHLLAFRISKEEILYNWIQYLKMVIDGYFTNTGEMFSPKEIFQKEFPEQLWINIETFVKNLVLLPLWKDRPMAKNIFSGKQKNDYWKCIFEKGKNPDGVEVLAKPLNWVDMIK